MKRIASFSLFLQNFRMTPIRIFFEGSGGILEFSLRGSLQIKARRRGRINTNVLEAICRPSQRRRVQGFETTLFEGKGNHSNLFGILSRNFSESGNGKHSVGAYSFEETIKFVRKRGIKKRMIKSSINTHKFSKESVANSSVVVLARTEDPFSDGHRFIASAT